MAFLRTSFSALKANKNENFESTYKFRKKVDFKPGTDVYVLPLGLDYGFFETPVHTIQPHEVDGQTIGFGGAGFAQKIKCKGYDEFGNKVDSLCCRLAKMEYDKYPEQNDSIKRVLNFSKCRIHIPVLILGNSLTDKSKISYPISKVSILNELNSEKGLNFSFLEMASSTFQSDIFNKLGEELKNKNVIDYELSDQSEEYFQIVGKELMNTVIKIKGVSKNGFAVALPEYSLFRFADEAIASGSPAGEREAIVNYRNNDKIMEKVNEYLQLFRAEVDNLFRDWNDKELQEYYNSATGADLKANIAPVQAPVAEKIEVIAPAQPVVETPAQPINEVKTEVASDDDINNFINDPFGGQDPTAQPVTEVEAQASSNDLDNFEFDFDADEDFLA